MRYKYSENLTEASEMTFAENEYQGIEQNGTMKRIPTTKIKQGIDDAINIIKGVGYTEGTLKTHEDRLDTLEGADTVEGSVAKTVKDAVDPIDERIDNIIASSGTSDTEVVDARLSGSTGVLYTLLKNRLDAMEKHLVVTNEIGVPVATIKFRMSGNQPQLVTEAL